MKCFFMHLTSATYKLTLIYAGDIYLGNVCVKELSTEVAGGFVGCTVGMFADHAGVSAGEGKYAAFTSFEYLEA